MISISNAHRLFNPLTAMDILLRNNLQNRYKALYQLNNSYIVTRKK